MEKRISPKEAAAIIGYSVSTLNRWRKAGIGPKWVVEENGRIAYRMDWIREWDESVWSKSKCRQ